MRRAAIVPTGRRVRAATGCWVTRSRSCSTATTSTTRRCVGSHAGRTCRRRHSCSRPRASTPITGSESSRPRPNCRAGHPTLGTCHAWLEAGGGPRGDAIVQECAAGLIPIRSTDAGWRSRPAAGAIGTGRRRTGAAARGDAANRSGRDRRQPVGRQRTGLGRGAPTRRRGGAGAGARRPRGREGRRGRAAVRPRYAGQQAFEVRAFFSSDGATREDPVTGSLNASLAGWLLATGRATAPYTAAQGAALARRGTRPHLGRRRRSDLGGGRHPDRDHRHRRALNTAADGNRWVEENAHLRSKTLKRRHSPARRGRTFGAGTG